ncbi:MAG: hypothetical protein ACRC5C_03855, partial [Bacilli bacterium]
RFSKEKELYTEIATLIVKHFQSHGHMPTPNKQALPDRPKSEQMRLDYAQAERVQESFERPEVAYPTGTGAKEAWKNDRRQVKSEAPLFDEVADLPFQREEVAQQVLSDEDIGVVPSLKDFETDTRITSNDCFTIQQEEHEEQSSKEQEQSQELRTSKLPQVDVVGQVHGTYWIFQNEDGMYMLDQHAAQERIHYEQYYERLGSESGASQLLGIPIVMTLPPSDSVKLEQRTEEFLQLGIDLNHLGGNEWIVRSYPTWMKQHDAEETIETMITMLLEKGSVQQHKVREAVAIMMSCKASIKANHYMTPAHALRLYADLGRCEQPYTCPHGRPILISFSAYDLEKLFKRA